MKRFKLTRKHKIAMSKCADGLDLKKAQRNIDPKIFSELERADHIYILEGKVYARIECKEE